MYRLLTPLLAVIVAITLFTTFVKPTFDEYQAIDTEIADYELALEKANDLQRRINELIAEKDAIAATDHERLLALLPDEHDGVAVVLALDEAANRNRMVLEGISVKNSRMPTVPDVEVDQSPYQATEVAPPVEQDLGATLANAKSISSLPVTDFYEDVTVSFNVTGTYEDFKLFIAEIEKSLVLMDISKLSIAEANEDDLAGFEVELTLYQFKNPFIE